MEFKRAYFLSSFVILAIALGFASGYAVKSAILRDVQEHPVLYQAEKILRDHGMKDPPDDPALEYGMIQGMVQAYDDPYTVFVEPVQHELESNSLTGSFGGIGVRVVRDGGGNVLLFPLPGSPAQDAGIQEGDILLEIDEQLVLPETPTNELQSWLRGPVGEWVEVLISRPPSKSEIKFKIKRAEIPLPSVIWHLDPDETKLGVIEINLIAESTPQEIQNAVGDLSSRGASAYVLDLRDNSGGLLTAGIDTARLFLERGVILQQQYRGQGVETYKVEKPGPFSDIPLAVLINENSASAAEIIAGALKVHARAIVLGKPTYGKDTIQLVFDLEDGSSLHVSAAHWWIPGLDPFSMGHGVMPDVLVDPSSEPIGPDPYIRAAAVELFGTK